MEEIKPSERIHELTNHYIDSVDSLSFAIIDYLDEQAAKRPEPSKCEHAYHDSNIGKSDCIKCGKPSDSGDEKEVEQLETHLVIFKEGCNGLGSIRMTMRALFDLYAEDMGYSKHDLVVLDKGEVCDVLADKLSLYESAMLSEKICAKFGQPKAKVMSLQNIIDCLIDDWCQGSVKNKDYLPACKHIEIVKQSKAIHQAMLREETNQ